ncbi:MAG: uroporphyrinogen decarboxylase family protein [Kiritimatiellae bacterium]|nr:uroporphyrinogen decarboxylase family protein [Kiritimatiellia bacterium]
MPDPDRTGRLPLRLEALKGLKAELGDTAIVAGRIAAPFSGVALLLGAEATLVLMIEAPGLLRKFMDYIHACNTIVTQAQLEAGADVLWIGDCVATSLFISLEDYRRFALEHANGSCRVVRTLGGLSIYHEAASNGGYMFCTAEGIPHDTPASNVAAMVRTVKKDAESHRGL